MKLSARNVLKGTVKELKPGVVTTEVVLSIPGGIDIVSTITNESAHHLGLAPGKEAYALVKAPLVIIAAGEPQMRFSTRNMLKGTISLIERGAVNAEVTLNLPSGQSISAVITMSSVNGMGLKTGDSVTALFKASSVILATPI